MDQSFPFKKFPWKTVKIASLSITHDSLGRLKSVDFSSNNDRYIINKAESPFFYSHGHMASEMKRSGTI